MRKVRPHAYVFKCERPQSPFEGSSMTAEPSSHAEKSHPVTLRPIRPEDEPARTQLSRQLRTPELDYLIRMDLQF